MSLRRFEIVFCDTFAPTGRDLKVHDALGYWGSSDKVIKNYFLQSGHRVCSIPQTYLATDDQDIKMREMLWLTTSYAELAELPWERFDVVFMSQIFYLCAGEVKRILCYLGKRNLPIVGYTHGSHWDPSDTYRLERYPGLHMTDLANLYSLDRILVVSNYMKGVLVKNISELNAGIGQEIHTKARVVGLPINTELLDKCRTTDKFESTTLIYNHSLIQSKNPEMFFRVISKILERYRIRVIITRKIPVGSPAFSRVQELLRKFKDRIILGDNLPVDDYYHALWKADIQVSTAIHESLGMSTLEAMYAMNCCILPNHASYPEISNNYKDILYVYDDDALYEKICYFIENRTARERVAKDLHELSTNYTIDKVGPRILEAIGEVV